MKKGFTLIELLAVIIILAVIALIATPVVLNVVDNAKKQAAVNSAYGIIDAAKYVYTESLMTDSITTSGEAASLKVSGDKATTGTWSLDTTTGTISLTGVAVSGYTCSGYVGSMTCE